MLDEYVGSRQTLGTNDLTIENVGQTTLMPTHDQDHENTKFNENTCKKNQEFCIYSRRNHIQKMVEPTLQQGHESISRTDPISPLEKGKVSSKPCSSSNINHEESRSDLDVPIAFRKGVRSCTKHLMSNFMSYKNLSSSMVAFTSQLSSVEILKNVENALKFQSGRRLFLRK